MSPPNILELSSKQSFILKEVCILAWGGSVQRANLYNKHLPLEDRGTTSFRLTILEFVELRLLPNYINKCSEQEHIANIKALVEHGTQTGQAILGHAGYKVGVAQKLLNLLLKYLWCLGYVSEPPHCPVDRIVLEKTRLKGKMNWTEINSMEQYNDAIIAIREVASAKGLSLAEWELDCFSRR